ncbi:MAG: VOC family protein [Chloroflexi bacterium]|nr:VOC family protein [Chloroflexota bacterium]MCC6895085.1 VOC family protein [Anaerolineae bacterium]
MINRVGTVSIYVSDQQRAKAFYTEKLGFELLTEAPLYPGASSLWIAVAPKGAQTHVILYLPDENWEHYKGVVGKSQAVTLDVTDMQGVAADLKAKGVQFASEPDVQPWGTYATIIDSEGNKILLVESRSG